MIKYKHKQTGDVITILFTNGKTNYYYDEDGNTKSICDMNLNINYRRVDK